MTEKQQPAQDFRVVVFADFVCPYSFLAVDQIDRLAREYDVRPLWRPHWLHPETPLEGTPREPAGDDGARRERLQAWVKEMAPEQFPRIRFPTKRCYSFKAFEALEFAYDCGLDFQYKTALYDVLWTEGGDIGEIDTLVAAGERVGLEPADLKLALEENHYTDRTLEAVNTARRIGISSTPTIFLGRTRINGWHYYEVLQSIMDKQGARLREEAA